MYEQLAIDQNKRDSGSPLTRGVRKDSAEGPSLNYARVLCAGMTRCLIVSFLLLCLTPTTVIARAKIITDPNDTTTRFEAPAAPHIAPAKPAAYPIPSLENPPLPSPSAKGCAEEGRTRYNGAPEVKGVEFCDGTKWVGLMKTAPTANSTTATACSQQEESFVRYNKHKDVKAYEFCNGTTWLKMGSQNLSIESKIYNSPATIDKTTPALLTGGEFRKDGYVGAYLACEQGANQLSAYLTVGTDTSVGAVRDKLVSATVLSNRSGTNDVAQSSFFAYVPKNTPWKIWVRENYGNGLLNKALCAIKVTKFGT